jgi:hypothetical protein
MTEKIYSIMHGQEYSNTVKKDPLKGINNGTSGMGMARGSVFPSSMNGPFGYQKHPLPINLNMPIVPTSSEIDNGEYPGPCPSNDSYCLKGPYTNLNLYPYNSAYYNYPQYNRNSAEFLSPEQKIIQTHGTFPSPY